MVSRFQAMFGRHYLKNSEDYEAPESMMYDSEYQMTLIHWEFVVKRHIRGRTSFRLHYRATMNRYPEALESLVRKVKSHQKEDQEELWITFVAFVKENWKLILDKLSVLILENQEIDVVNFMESEISWAEVKDLWKLHDSYLEPKKFPIIYLDWDFRDKVLGVQLTKCLSKENMSQDFLKKVFLGKENILEVFPL